MSAKKAQILIVDDYPTNIKVLSDLLIEYGFEVLIARDGENALQKLQRITPDIILLDILMPNMDGYETYRHLKEQESTQDIPVIFMTALSDPVDKVKGLTLGAVDYITKPFQQEEVLARINTHLKLRHLTKRLEEQNAQLQEEARSRRLAEAALRLSEEKFATAFRSNPGPMMILTLEEGRLLEINQNFCQILGYPLEAVLGKTLAELRLFCESEECDRVLATLRQDRLIDNHECRLYTQAREIRTLLISAEVINVGNQPCVLAMAFDITKCKQAAVDLKMAIAEAERANRAKSRFLANISHELRSPLNTILGYTQLLDRDLSLTVEQKANLSIINRSGEHLLTLINDVLEMAKIESGQILLNEMPFNLSDLLKALYEMFQPKAAAKGLRLILEKAADVPLYVYADATKLRQVLINLLDNGIKFTATGQVTLRMWTGPAPGAEDGGTRLPASFGQCLHCAVEDTGPGIANNDIATLFDPFVQTETGRRTHEGTGLGLPISQQFVQLMGGQIRVNSTVGQGTTFAFTIPLTPVEDTTPAGVPALKRVVGLAPNQPEYRILVVEDQAHSRRLLVKLISSVGFQVREAEDGEAAIALYRQWSPHLIWMDVRMPVLDGYETARRIQQLQAVTQPQGSSDKPAAKILALTANAFEEERMAALAAGYDDFVRKPIQANLIFEKMAEYLGVCYTYQDPEPLPPDSADGNDPIPSTPASFTIDAAILADLRRMVADDDDFLTVYLASYLETLPQWLQTLQDAVTQKNPVTLARAAHSLKGIGRTFGATSMADLCQAIEMIADGGITAIPTAQLQQVAMAVNSLLMAIRQEHARLLSTMRR